MAEFSSFLAPLIEEFVYYRKASGCWNEVSYEANLALFDRYCSKRHPAAQALSQEMVDGWCGQRDTETGNSCRARTSVVVAFVKYLRARSLTPVAEPPAPKTGRSGYIPHAFTDAELGRFFDACDHLPDAAVTPEQRSRRIMVPVFFRLLYSSGIRTTEARLLRVGDVDLGGGVLSVRDSKGPGQHYVALHPSMTELMAWYEAAIGEQCPGRTYFFPARNDGCHGRAWVHQNFKQLWSAVNAAQATPYQLRHHYATQNINRWVGEGLGFDAKLLSLSKSMGHTTLESTRRYYSLVPGIAGVIEELTGSGFDEIVPEPGDG
jgi:integrase